MSRSAERPTLSHGLLQFLVDHFGLRDDRTKSLTLYTQYKCNNTTFWCHPNYRGSFTLFDWVMMLYTDVNYPNQTLRCPARLMVVVQDNSDAGNIYHPVLQWAGQRTMSESVLF